LEQKRYFNFKQKNSQQKLTAPFWRKINCYRLAYSKYGQKLGIYSDKTKKSTFK